MADGYLIEVTTPEVGADAPVTAMWYAHIPDRDEALAAVLAESGSAATAEIVKPLTHLMLTEVSVPEGGVRPYD